jgi:hypothetical protein
MSRAQVVKGTVRDATTRLAIEGAFTALIDTTRGIVFSTSTDTFGRYALPVRHPGTYAVVTTHLGHLRQVSDWLHVTAIDTFDIQGRTARTGAARRRFVTIDSVECGRLGIERSAVGTAKH